MLQYNEFMCTALSLLIRKSNQKEKKKRKSIYYKAPGQQAFPLLCTAKSV